MVSFEFPEVRYADANGVRIAYELRGEGSIDMVRVPGSWSSVLATCLDTVAVAQADRVAAFCRLICLDRRGTGLSDPVLEGAMPPLEQRVADVLSVMDTVGSRSAVLFGSSDAAQVAVLCAAMHPDRVDALILTNAFARYFRSSSYPFGLDPASAERAARLCKEHWGNVDDPWGIDAVPSRREEPGFRQVLARVQQVSASPSVAAALAMSDTDVTDVLPLVQARTLVMYAKDAKYDIPSHAAFLAEHIPNARAVAYPGADIYYGADHGERVAIMQEWLTGTSPISVTDRVLATVLFTDIVGSTERLAEVGDQEWLRQLDQHDSLVRHSLARFNGREISTAGDSFFATFGGPARAIQCAQSIVREAGQLGIKVRAGVHAGECEVRGEDLGGIAVHVGARVAALAGAGQVLTTSTVKDLVAGSGINFADHGIHDLKGIPDPWHLYEVHS